MRLTLRRAHRRGMAGEPHCVGRTQRIVASRRIWAWIALIAAAGVLAALVVLLFRDLVTLVFALVALGLAAAALWVAATRRGIARLLGIAVAILALAGGAVALVLRDAVDELVAVAVAIAVFGAAGRVTFRQARSARVADPVGSAPRPSRPKRGVLLINPKSGGGKAGRFNLSEEARKRGIEPVVLERGDDLLELAERAVSDGAEVIGMAGGDGSQALVATIAMQHDRAHVCIPSGTRNHFALDLGLDRNDVVGALDAYTDGVERRIDLARVNDRVFVNNASLGVYARVVQSDAYRDAKLETWAQLLPDMLGPDAPPIDLVFNGPDTTEYDDAPLVLVSNNPYQLTRLAGAGTRLRLDTGRVGIVAARIRSASDVSQLVTLETIGQLQRFRGLLEWSQPEFEVRSGSPVAVALDGEALTLEPPLRFVSLPGALRVLLPRNAGDSPAAASVALTRSNVMELFRVATGRANPTPADRSGEPIAMTHNQKRRTHD
jgi:diacylglycerol kinase family enzyme